MSKELPDPLKRLGAELHTAARLREQNVHQQLPAPLERLGAELHCAAVKQAEEHVSTKQAAFGKRQKRLAPKVAVGLMAVIIAFGIGVFGSGKYFGGPDVSRAGVLKQALASVGLQDHQIALWRSDEKITLSRERKIVRTANVSRKQWVTSGGLVGRSKTTNRQTGVVHDLNISPGEVLLYSSRGKRTTLLPVTNQRVLPLALIAEMPQYQIAALIQSAKEKNAQATIRSINQGEYRLVIQSISSRQRVVFTLDLKRSGWKPLRYQLIVRNKQQELRVDADVHSLKNIVADDDTQQQLTTVVPKDASFSSKETWSDAENLLRELGS